MNPQSVKIGDVAGDYRKIMNLCGRCNERVHRAERTTAGPSSGYETAAGIGNGRIDRQHTGLKPQAQIVGQPGVAAASSWRTPSS